MPVVRFWKESLDADNHLSAFPQKTKMRTSRWWMELPFDAIPLISILYLHLLNLFSSFG